MEQLFDYRARLLERLEGQPAALDDLIRARPEAGWRARRAAGGLTLHQVLAHLRDLESLAFLPRVRLILAEDAPALEPFPSHHWSIESYRSEEMAAAIGADFARARAEALTLLRPLTPEGWCRAGFHPPSGYRTVLWWAERMYLHAQEHLDELRRAPNS
jgi:hypothetical protein